MVTARSRSVPGWLDHAASLAWRALVVGAALYVGIVVFGRLRVVVVPLIVALFLSTVLVPPARWLRGRGWPPLAATWAVFIGGRLVVAGGRLCVLPPVSHHFRGLPH